MPEAGEKGLMVPKSVPLPFLAWAVAITLRRGTLARFHATSHSAGNVTYLAASCHCEKAVCDGCPPISLMVTPRHNGETCATVCKPPHLWHNMDIQNMDNSQSNSDSGAKRNGIPTLSLFWIWKENFRHSSVPSNAHRLSFISHQECTFWVNISVVTTQLHFGLHFRGISQNGLFQMT